MICPNCKKEIQKRDLIESLYDPDWPEDSPIILECPLCRAFIDFKELERKDE